MKGGGGGKKRYIKKYTSPLTEQGSLYGGSGVTTESCKSIKFNTRLQKPTAVVRTLLVGDELSLRHVNTELQALNTAGQVCGSIVSTLNSKLIECIGKGYSYKAVVYSIAGSACDVTVQIA